jgi:hypothetical protein
LIPDDDTERALHRLAPRLRRRRIEPGYLALLIVWFIAFLAVGACVTIWALRLR